MISIYCEWDVGQELLLFPSEELAYIWLTKNLVLIGMAEEEKQTIEEFLAEVFDDGLLGYDRLTIVREV